MQKRVDLFLSEDYRRAEARTPVGGTPQGAGISPLPANICLHPLDRQMGQKADRMVRYADDFWRCAERLKKRERRSTK